MMIVIRTTKKKIPKCCVSCQYYRQGYCAASGMVKVGIVVSKERPKWCPMEEIQPDRVQVGSDDFGIVLLCAVRYAAGRQTYMPGLIQSFIRPLIPDLSQKTLQLMERDLTEYRRDGRLGDPEIDAPGWIQLLLEIRTAMDRRKIERLV